MKQHDIRDRGRPFNVYVRWARQHRRLSVGAIRRRFPVSIAEGEAILAALLARRVLHPRPEGESYQVRYPAAVRATGNKDGLVGRALGAIRRAARRSGKRE